MVHCIQDIYQIGVFSVGVPSLLPVLMILYDT